MNSKQSNKRRKKTITVEDFLAATSGKRYKVKSSEMYEISTELNGVDIPHSYRMDTVEEIIANKDGSYVLNYGAGISNCTFQEV